MADVQPRSAFTPTQRKILRVLADGLPHKSADLKLCLLDGEQASRAAVRQQIHQIRKLLRMIGQDVVCVVADDGFRYQHILKLKTAS